MLNQCYHYYYSSQPCAFSPEYCDCVGFHSDICEIQINLRCYQNRGNLSENTVGHKAVPCMCTGPAFVRAAGWCSIMAPPRPRPICAPTALSSTCCFCLCPARRGAPGRWPKNLAPCLVFRRYWSTTRSRNDISKFHSWTKLPTLPFPLWNEE